MLLCRNLLLGRQERCTSTLPIRSTRASRASRAAQADRGARAAGAVRAARAAGAAPDVPVARAVPDAPEASAFSRPYSTPPTSHLRRSCLHACSPKIVQGKYR